VTVSVIVTVHVFCCHCGHRYLDHDVFKLDIIAHELKGLEKEISRCRSAVAGVDVKGLTNFSDREKMTAALYPLVDVLSTCRTHMCDVINQCPTETRKLHIGARFIVFCLQLPAWLAFPPACSCPEFHRVLL
jgi:hypothetical protein